MLVPLVADDEPFGAIAAGFPWPGGPDDEDLDFLEAYAERAAAVILQARVYEDERAAAAELAEIDRQKSEFLALRVERAAHAAQRGEGASSTP